METDNPAFTAVKSNYEGASADQALYDEGRKIGPENLYGGTAAEKGVFAARTARRSPTSLSR